VIGFESFCPDTPRTLDGLFLPHGLISSQGSLVPLLKFQMAPIHRLVTSSGSKKKEPNYARLSEARVSHSHKMWAEFSSSAPYLLHRGLSISPIKWRCLFKVLCPVRRPVTNLNCVLFKDSNIFFAVDLEPEINFRACLWVLTRPRHVIIHIGYLSSVCSTDRRIRLKALSLISINDKRNTGMDHYWNGTNKRKPNYTEKNLS